MCGLGDVAVPLADRLHPTHRAGAPTRGVAHLAGAFDRFGERWQLLWDLAEAFEIAHRPAQLALGTPDEQAHLRLIPEEQKLPQVYAECREALRSAFIVVDGAFQKQGAVVTIVAERVLIL